MNTLPVELLEQIITHPKLDVADVWNCRLVNSLWHKWTTELLRSSSRIKFTIKDLNQLIEFNRLIPPGALLPTQKFKFHGNVICTGSSTLHVKKFASTFGQSINVLEFGLPVFGVDDEDSDFSSSVSSSTSSEEDESGQEESGVVSTQAESGAVLPKFLTQEDYIKLNISILLKSAVSNLQALWIFGLFAIGHIDGLPSTFPKLCDIVVCYCEPKPFEVADNSSLPLLDQIVSRVPKIKLFRFINHRGGGPNCLKNLPGVLENLSKMNDNVKVSLQFELRPDNASDVLKVLNTPSPKIIELNLKVPWPFDLETANTFTQRLKKWVKLHADHLRFLTLTEDVTVVHTIFEGLVINLPCLMSLEELDILHIRHRVTNQRSGFRVLPEQLPKLRIITMQCEIAKLFTGEFPNVTELHLPYSADDVDFETKLQSTFPNVKVLTIGSIRVAFKFFKLTRLGIIVSIRPAVNYWDILTGGMPRVPDSEICIAEASEQPEGSHPGNYDHFQMSSFKNLQYLDYVRFQLTRRWHDLQLSESAEIWYIDYP